MLHEFEGLKVMMHTTRVNIKNGACEHLMQYDSQGPDIALLAVGVI